MLALPVSSKCHQLSATISSADQLVPSGEVNKTYTPSHDRFRVSSFHARLRHGGLRMTLFFDSDVPTCVNVADVDGIHFPTRVRVADVVW